MFSIPSQPVGNQLRTFLAFSITLILLLPVTCAPVMAQDTTAFPTFSFKNGIGVVAPDSAFSLNFRFRMQARAAYATVSESDLIASAVEARIRRLRLRFEGFTVSPKLTYYIQLSFSRGDMDWVNNDFSLINSSPNVVRDATIMYRPNSNLLFTFGQTKLPGNRQRVVSSGELQFADRSIVNSVFTIDRDFGIQAAYQNNIKKLHYVLKGAVSTGEGRNSVISVGGLAYTGRVEVLPFGKFTNKGDYFEGDLERERSPKLSVAGGYHYNKNARRTGGTLGNDLYQARDMNSLITDMVFKYQGFALTAEYLNRRAENPITENAQGQIRRIVVGEGKMVQASYLFKNDFEVAARYARISPYRAIQQIETQAEEIVLGGTKYLRKHRVKLQGNLFYNRATNLILDKTGRQNWVGMFQIELGI